MSLEMPASNSAPKRKNGDSIDREGKPQKSQEEMWNDFFTEVDKLSTSLGSSGGDGDHLSVRVLLELYRNAFGKEALTESAIAYRVKSINESDFPDDFLVDPNAGLRQPKYFISPKNRELLKKIFSPKDGNATWNGQFQEFTDRVKGREDLLRARGDILEAGDLPEEDDAEGHIQY